MATGSLKLFGGRWRAKSCGVLRDLHRQPGESGASGCRPSEMLGHNYLNLKELLSQPYPLHDLRAAGWCGGRRFGNGPGADCGQGQLRSPCLAHCFRTRRKLQNRRHLRDHQPCVTKLDARWRTSKDAGVSSEAFARSISSL